MRFVFFIILLIFAGLALIVSIIGMSYLGYKAIREKIASKQRKV